MLLFYFNFVISVENLEVTASKLLEILLVQGTSPFENKVKRS